jgi:hypothetical protein
VEVFRVLLSVVMVCVLITPGGCVPGASDSPTLQVNDHLRTACSAMSDVLIVSNLTAINVARDNGVTYETEIQTVLDSCANSDGGVNCDSCWTALVNQVYGK